MLTPSQKLREAEEDEAAAAAVEDTPHHTSWGGRGRRGATGPSPLFPADSIPPKRKRAQVRQCSRCCGPGIHYSARQPEFSRARVLRP